MDSTLQVPDSNSEPTTSGNAHFDKVTTSPDTNPSTNANIDKNNKNKSKNMNKKNTIRLTESDLKRVIAESVKRVLKENEEKVLKLQYDENLSRSRGRKYYYCHNNGRYYTNIEGEWYICTDNYYLEPDVHLDDNVRVITESVKKLKEGYGDNNHRDYIYKKGMAKCKKLQQNIEKEWENNPDATINGMPLIAYENAVGEIADCLYELYEIMC